MNIDAKGWLERIHQLPLQGRTRIMNVCGGHERAITHAGLRSLLPDNIELIPGPGCPVCVCPEEDLYEAIQIALHQPVTLIAFGDMLRVPANTPKGTPRTLEQARAAGADVRPIASPSEAVKIARADPTRQVVFFVAGFETTSAPVAAMVAEGIPDNLTLLLSARLTWPAVAMLLESDDVRIDGLIAPGHVAATMGAQEWQFIIDQHQLPVAIAGFTPESLLAALYSVLRQRLEQNLFLDNCYPEVVKSEGNQRAQQILDQVFEVTDANWRGIGTIPDSGFSLRPAYQAHDARRQWPQYRPTARQRAGGMPAGCDCAAVVLGQKYPNECRLYGISCTPRTPVGPCMVSDEGACHIWWQGGIRSDE
ncbi:MAG: hydrogenase formation protein HypD [Pseudomonadota bacterium]